ncbi:MAG: gliding motility lipoprotein GldD [Flavobacteriales bacterium]|jgi:gliding motility-associated lipoprotein GldD
MRNKFSVSCFLCLLLVIASCSDDDYFLPKPKSYFRIDLPGKKYESTSSELPFSFEKPVFSIIQKRKNINQFNLVFPLHKAKVHFTYFSLENQEIQPFLEDAYNYAYKHNSKATAINTSNHRLDSTHVYGLSYELKGNVASPLQFFATDSVSHFLRGALYFDHSPNADSIAPVLEYIETDIEHFYKTLEWKN